jgi:DnaK suppressor protein
MADSADQAQEYLEAAMRVYAGRPQPDKQAPLKPGRVSGECVDCGDDIDPGRLKIFPYAVRCAECQAVSER